MAALKSLSCAFYAQNIITSCYVDDQFVFGKEDSDFEHLNRSIGNDLVLNDYGKSRQALNIEIDWKSSDVVDFFNHV